MRREIAVRAAYAGLGAAVAIGVQAWLARPGKADADTVAALLATGATRAKVGTPKIEDLPKGAKAVATIEGEARWEPVDRPTSEGERKAVGSAASELPPCDLDRVGVSIHCRAELSRVGEETFGRLIAFGELRYGDQVRELEDKLAGTYGQPVGGVERVEPPKVVVSKDLERKRLALGPMVGLAYGTDARLGAELGLEWERRATGRKGYAMMEWQPRSGDRQQEFRVHGGYRW